MFFKKKPQRPPEIHPSQDDTLRHSDDQRLRKFGFAIHSRPKSGPTLWAYGNDIYDQNEAMELVEDMEEVERK